VIRLGPVGTGLPIHSIRRGRAVNSIEASVIVAADQLWKLDGASRWICEAFADWEIIAMQRDGRRTFTVYHDAVYHGSFYGFESAARVAAREDV
jgi:hypothetical protein